MVPAQQIVVYTLSAQVFTDFILVGASSLWAEQRCCCLFHSSCQSRQRVLSLFRRLLWLHLHLRMVWLGVGSRVALLEEESFQVSAVRWVREVDLLLQMGSWEELDG